MPPVARARASAPQFSAISIGPLAKDPVPRELTRRAADQHPRRRRRGDHTIIIGIRPETPELHRSPPTEILWDLFMGGTHCRHRRRQRVALLLQRGARLRLARTRAREIRTIKVYAAPFLLIFQCRLLREREQAPPSSVRFRSGRWRKTRYLASSLGAPPTNTLAAGAAATTPSSSASAPKRPSSIVRPQPKSFGTCLWVAPIVAIDGASGSLCCCNAALGFASHARARGKSAP